MKNCVAVKVCPGVHVSSGCAYSRHAFCKLQGLNRSLHARRMDRVARQNTGNVAQLQEQIRIRKRMNVASRLRRGKINGCSDERPFRR
jgi:uncharacterized protein YcbK (DUF882 family)